MEDEMLVSLAKQHTPAPWRAIGQLDGSTAIVDVNNRSILNRGAIEQLSNGLLIQAAPELLDALEAAYNFLMDGTPDDDKSPTELSIIKKIETALTSAVAGRGIE
jgi:hypothetical protein